MIPESVVDEIRARADIVEVVGEEVSLKRAGKDFRALCPFHHEKTPSFYVVPAKGFYKCFGCGESGDVFTFLMRRSGASFQDAVRELGARFGVEVPEPSLGREVEEPHRILYEAVAFADDWFRRNLRETDGGARARSYLTGRGITDDAIERFGIGYAPEGWRLLREAAHAHHIEDEVLLAAGLIKESERGDEPYDRFRNRIIFPIAELGGRVVAFGGRVLERAENAPKYLNSPESQIYHKGDLLYGLNWSKGSIRREGAALLVEGYMDYVSLAARGIENVAAGLGTALTTAQANLLARYAGKALLLYDSDTAGLRATFRTADALLHAGVHPLVVTLPTGEDPDSIVRQGGADALKPHLDAAMDVVERKLHMLEQRGFFDDIEGVRRALDRLLPTLRATVDPALRDIYTARVAQRTGVRRETLEQELDRAAARDAAQARRAAHEQRGPAEDTGVGPGRPGRPGRGARPPGQDRAAERLLLTVLIIDPARASVARQLVSGTDLLDARHREIYDALLELDSTTELRLSAPATALYEELRARSIEIVDADGSFESAVADIQLEGLSVREKYVDDQIHSADAGWREDLMRLKMELKSETSRLNQRDILGFKASRRYRELLGNRRLEASPPTREY
jgi:DNA primase